MMLCKKVFLVVGLQLAFFIPLLKAENAPAVHLIPSPVNRVVVVRLKNKTALVTAAGQGIGRATVLAMAAEGAQVWATDVNASLLGAYEGVANVRALRLDVLDKAAIQDVVGQMPAMYWASWPAPERMRR